MSNFDNQVKILRIFRKIHRTAGAFLFVLFFVVALTGILLGWKKHSNEWLIAHESAGSNTDSKKWITLDSIASLAVVYSTTHFANSIENNIDRIDVRPEKGMAKIIYKYHYNSLHIDLTTGKILKTEMRRSDFIEALHDGSILDDVFHTKNDFFKLLFTSVSGLALLMFTITGFWLWYGPKKLKKLKFKTKKTTFTLYLF